LIIQSINPPQQMLGLGYGVAVGMQRHCMAAAERGQSTEAQMTACNRDPQAKEINNNHTLEMIKHTLE